MIARTVSSWGIALALAAGSPSAASAQVGAFGGYYSSGMDQFNYVLSSIHLRSIERNAERRGNATKQAPQPNRTGGVSTVVARGAVPLAPQRLAARYPVAHRAQAQRTFGQLLDGYHQIETRFGLTPGDMAGAMAGLIAGSWSICRDRPIVDAHFGTLAGQLRGAIGQDPRFVQMSAADRQLAYEQFAILGTELALLQMALQQKPDAALKSRGCEAGRGYLGQFGLDPEKLDITAQGLVVAG